MSPPALGSPDRHEPRTGGVHPDELAARAKEGLASTPRSASRRRRTPSSSPPVYCSCRSSTTKDSPLRDQVALAMPLLEAVEQAALDAGVPVDARVEKGRSLTHALKRLWEAEPFDRIVAPAPRNGYSGFSEKELAWLLTHAPAETLVLKPMPVAA